MCRKWKLKTESSLKLCRKKNTITVLETKNFIQWNEIVQSSCVCSTLVTFNNKKFQWKFLYRWHIIMSLFPTVRRNLCGKCLVKTRWMQRGRTSETLSKIAATLRSSCFMCWKSEGLPLSLWPGAWSSIVRLQIAVLCVTLLWRANMGTLLLPAGSAADDEWRYAELV